MTTHAVTLEPSTISDLEQSLPAAFKKVDLRDIRVLKIDRTRVRIETPLRQLAKYHFVSQADHCSWRTPKGKLIVYLKGILVEQRAEISGTAFSHSQELVLRPLPDGSLTGSASVPSRIQAQLTRRRQL